MAAAARRTRCSSRSARRFMPRSRAAAAAPAQSVARVGGRVDAGVAQGRDVLEGEQILAGLDQGRAQFRARLADRVVEHRLQRAVLAQQLGRGLRADALGAGQAVGGVAAQGDEVGDQLGADPVALAHLARGRPLRRLCRRCGRRARSPRRRRTGTCRGRRSAAGRGRRPRPRAGVGAEQVVGLEVVAGRDGPAEGLEEVARRRRTGAPARRAFPPRVRRGRRGRARSGSRRRRGRSRGRRRAGGGSRPRGGSGSRCRAGR